jgi:hypothetical protein
MQKQVNKVSYQSLFHNNNFYEKKLIRSATLQIVCIFSSKLMAEPRSYIGGKPTSNVGSRFHQTD